MDYDVVKSESVYSGKILKVFKDEITMPGGKTAVRETVEKHNASAIVPIDKDGNIIFVRQYRHAAKDMILEIPAGTFEDNEDPYECALRELEEEIGNGTYLCKLDVCFRWNVYGKNISLCCQRP